VLAANLIAPDCLARWPVFTPAAVHAGVRAVFALPLQVGGIRLGVLDPQFCRQHGLSYCRTTLWRSYAQALHHLHQVGRPLRATPAG
jgi:hypothetical protein